MKKIVLFFDPVIPEHKRILEENVPDGMEMRFMELLDEEGKKASLKEAEFFLIVAHETTKEDIAGAIHLRHIQRTGIGVNNVDVAAADAARVTVSNLPRGNATAVAEHAILLPMAVYRNLTAIDRETKEGHWPVWKYRTRSYEMDGKVHGFIGMGNIGRLTAERSRAFGTHCIYYDLFRLPAEQEERLGLEYVSFDEVLKRADIVSLHVPLTKENEKMIGAKELAAMKPGSILINVSRGGLVDEAALYDAIKNGHIAGAGLDTWECEPDIKGNPLLQLDNVVATSHVAAATIDTFKKQVKGCFENLIKADRGEPAFTVGKVRQTRTSLM